MKLFKNYKREYETVCKVLSGTVDEVIKLREENEALKKKVEDMESTIYEQDAIIGRQAHTIREAREILSAK